MLEYNAVQPLSYTDIFSVISEYYVHQHPVCKKHYEVVKIIRQNEADKFIEDMRNSDINIIYLEKINENMIHKFSRCTVENMYVDHIWVIKVIRQKQYTFRHNVTIMETIESVIIADLGIILNVNEFSKIIDGTIIGNWKHKILIKTKSQK